MTEQQMLEALGNSWTYIDHDKLETVTLDERKVGPHIGPHKKLTYWAEGLAEKLLDLLADRVPFPEILSQMDLSRDCIYKKIRRFKADGTLPRDFKLVRLRPLNPDEMPLPSKSHERLKWTPEIDAEALRKLKEGVPVLRVANALGVTPASIRYRFKPGVREKRITNMRARRARGQG